MHKTPYNTQKIRIENIQEEKSYLFAYFRFMLLLGCIFELLLLKNSFLNGLNKLVFVCSKRI